VRQNFLMPRQKQFHNFRAHLDFRGEAYETASVIFLTGGNVGLERAIVGTFEALTFPPVRFCYCFFLIKTLAPQQATPECVQGPNRESFSD
jgi:hypothetical protein